jgi:cell division septal protein FtsQ
MELDGCREKKSGRKNQKIKKKSENQKKQKIKGPIKRVFYFLFFFYLLIGGIYIIYPL